MNLSNISILNLMPPNLAADKNVKMMAEAFDTVLRDIIEKIPDVEMIPNLILNKIVNETLIDLLAWQFHVDFYEPGLPVEIKRELVLKSLDWHFRKGTPSVVEEIISTVFTRARIQEWYEYGGRPYRFRIATEDEMSEAEVLKKFMRAINSVKNTRSFFDSLTYLTDFIENQILLSDSSGVQIVKNDAEVFGIHTKYNGAIKYDGHTINNEIWVYGKYNGAFKYDGHLTFAGTGRVPLNYTIRSTFKYSSRTIDAQDTAVKFEGFGDGVDIADQTAVRVRAAGFEDDVSAGDSLAVTVSKALEDDIPADDALTIGVLSVFSDSAETGDTFSFGVKASFEDAVEAADAPAVSLLKNLEDDVSVDDALAAAVSTALEDAVGVDDSFSLGMMSHHAYDGLKKYDGSMKYDSMVLKPLAA